MDQPPSGGCVLKHFCAFLPVFFSGQPPSGGCVLKQQPPLANCAICGPAAFRRLCVETIFDFFDFDFFCQPPSGGCVLKPSLSSVIEHNNVPAAFRRLCVETLNLSIWLCWRTTAAFRRLCVETSINMGKRLGVNQPPSGGCVLKRTSQYVVA